MHEINAMKTVYEEMGLDADTYARLMDTARVAVEIAHSDDNFNSEVNHRPAAQQWAVCTP